jgi:hypothetical protein
MTRPTPTEAYFDQILCVGPFARKKINHFACAQSDIYAPVPPLDRIYMCLFLQIMALRLDTRHVIEDFL